MFAGEDEREFAPGFKREAVALFEAVEYAALERVHGFNTRRLLEPIGNIPPAEAEARHCAETEVQAWAA